MPWDEFTLVYTVRQYDDATIVGIREKVDMNDWYTDGIGTASLMISWLLCWCSSKVGDVIVANAGICYQFIVVAKDMNNGIQRYVAQFPATLVCNYPNFFSLCTTGNVLIFLEETVHLPTFKMYGDRLLTSSTKEIMPFFTKLVSCPVSGQRVQFPAINRKQKFHSIRSTKGLFIWTRSTGLARFPRSRLTTLFFVKISRCSYEQPGWPGYRDPRWKFSHACQHSSPVTGLKQFRQNSFALTT